ncbi:hypothetical protein MMC30_003647 [Trapelia coarctata]|nr:hypothetical protein [Trapelia coarctata]
MQTVWSRATQLRSTCRCPSCISAPTATVTRRCTTGTLPKRIRFGDVFTVFYSSVLATAAVADAEWKDAKRRDLDVAIEKATEDLKATEREQERRIQRVLLRAQDELRNVKTEGPKNTQTLQDIFRTASTGKFPIVPFAEPRNPWSDAGGVQIGINARSRAPHTRRYYGISTALRGRWPSAEQAESRSVEGTQAEGGIISRPDGDIGAALEQHDSQSLSEARIKIQLKRCKSWRGEPGWAMRNRIEKPSLAIPTTHESKNMSQDAELALPRLVHRPSGAGAKNRLEYKLDTLCLKHVGGGFPLGTLPHGRSTFDIWELAGELTPLDGRDTSRIETSVAWFVFRLLVRAIDASNSGSAYLKLPDNTFLRFKEDHRRMLKMMTAQLASRLKAPEPSLGTVPRSQLFPKYTSQEAKGRPDQRKLNEKLYCLSDSQPLVTLLSIICHHLLASPTPPDVHTYNVLIVKFCNLQYYDLAATAISSMFRGGIYPNEITTAAILRFFIHTSDEVRFNKYADFLNCKSLKAVVTPDSETGMATQRPAYNFQYEDMAACNAATHKELILGWLRFGKFEQALVEYQVMAHRGYLKNRINLDRRILIAILQHCVQTANWEWGTAVWEALKERCDAGQHELIAEQYYWMLQLCVVCGRESDFDLVVVDGIKKGRQQPAGLLPWGLQMSDFVSASDEVRCLMDDVRLLERLKDPRALPGDYKQKTEVPLLSGTRNLREWITQSLRELDPKIRSRAEEARPFPHPLHYPRNQEKPAPEDNLAELVETLNEEPRNVSQHTHSGTPDGEVLEDTGRHPAAGCDYADDLQYKAPIIEDEPPQSLPTWV